ncbi:hypothetical protein TruAng_007506 [Truncatella angustata]|nr:hypothetical protein TruAng_007506 [Truncatella angustata]
MSSLAVAVNAPPPPPLSSGGRKRPVPASRAGHIRGAKKIKKAKLPRGAIRAPRAAVTVIRAVINAVANADDDNADFAGPVNVSHGTWVFLSANPLNIEVFRSIAKHDTFRHGVVEIVWDDTRLMEDVDSDEEEKLERDLRCLSDDGISESQGKDEAPRWYLLLCRQNRDEITQRGCFDKERPAHRAHVQQREEELSLNESWAYYQRLLRQQREVLSGHADAEALRYGLSRFPSLRKVTITPATHGFWLNPLYETPMIRAFPKSFNYPIPRSWPVWSSFGIYIDLEPWDNEEERRKWRGVSIVLRELARQEHQVVELSLYTNNLYTGMSCRMFERPCQEYDDFKTLMSRSGFRYLDLSLIADSEDNNDWESFRNGRLRSALSQATALEHLDFRMQLDADQDLELEFLPPLRTMLPFDRWPALRHFGLTNLLVAHDDLLCVLRDLPAPVRSVELSHMRFLDERRDADAGQGYRGLLYRIREELDWRTRPPNERPYIKLHVGSKESSIYRYICLNKEVNKFVYEDRENPFGRPGDADVRRPKVSKGVVKDPFEPGFKAPE